MEIPSYAKFNNCLRIHVPCTAKWNKSGFGIDGTDCSHFEPHSFYGAPSCEHHTCFGGCSLIGVYLQNKLKELKGVIPDDKL